MSRTRRTGVRSRIAVISAAVTAAAVAAFGAVATAGADEETSAADPAQAAGFQIVDGRLVDANGNDFVIRGVSHPHVWYQGETESFAEIKQLGANAVRVVLGSGQRWGPNSAEDVANVVAQCKENRLICILEVHDTTGYGEEAEAATLNEAVAYWQSIHGVLEGEEEYVLINIGNEPFGNNEEANENWQLDTSAAIAQLRQSGFEHTLVVDAPNWGQDWQGIMRVNAAAVLASDADSNTMFSIHMYGVYEDHGAIFSYLESFTAARMPIMVGEFGHDHSDGDPDEDTIMAEAQERGVGYIGWSYGGNSSEVAYLDMTDDFDPNSLTEWGERIFNGPDGIVATAQEATVYE